MGGEGGGGEGDRYHLAMLAHCAGKLGEFSRTFRTDSPNLATKCHKRLKAKPARQETERATNTCCCPFRRPARGGGGEDDQE